MSPTVHRPAAGRTPVIRTRRRPQRKGRPRVLGVGLALAVVGANLPYGTGVVSHALHQAKVNSATYKKDHGHWAMVDVPPQLRVNAVHAALLRTGKVLLIAGSGNDEERFEKGTFRSVLWDPATNRFTEVPTPEDLFCAGHAFLPDGRLLVAGGTQRYEVLEPDVTRAAGPMTVRNENPDDGPLRYPKGARFLDPGGRAYRATNAFVVPRAVKTEGVPGRPTVTAGSVVVWVEAETEGASGVNAKATTYRLEGTTGTRSHDVYGRAEKLTLAKQDFQGTATTYAFDPVRERYERLPDMAHKRWYPTLVGLRDGKVLASSGLDGTGQVVDGHTEVFDPRTRTWTERPELRRFFPTYPSLFMVEGGRLFYSGSNSGYGEPDRGRTPGIWDLTRNSFAPVPGLRDPDLMETSGSVLLPPVQSQKVMVAGGGGVGESPRSTARTDIAHLHGARPHFTPGPDLQDAVRYPNLVVLPTDEVLVTGGSSGYRGRGGSDVLSAQIYRPDPGTGRGEMRTVAAPTVPRNYHSEAILLPDGRVATFGSDSLFGDPDDSTPGTFEQRIEVFSPPYLFRGDRPVIRSVRQPAPPSAKGGAARTVRLEVEGGSAVRAVRLVRPSAATHVTDVEQRSVLVPFTASGGRLTATLPSDPSIAPPGHYMLVVVDARGVPSPARWIRVGY